MKPATSPPNHKKSVLSSAILGALGSAQAATINVDGSCTLVEAIQAANADLPVGTCTAGSGNDIIQVVTPDSGITISTIFCGATTHTQGDDPTGFGGHADHPDIGRWFATG